MTLALNGKAVDLSTPKVMGILNITDDSFYDGGRHLDEKTIRVHVEKMLEQEVDIIDVGGYSSRPGALDISIKEELRRVKSGIRAVMDVDRNAMVSVDTFRSEVAAFALDEGACMVNDISAGDLDPQMPVLVAKYQAAYVAMHMIGTPQNMMQNTHYDNLIFDILDHFVKKLTHFTQIGIKDVIIDAGFGFSKNTDQNYQLMEKLSFLKVLNCPLLVGISRKSMIYKLTGSTPEEALNGTTVLNTIALLKHANILRVHDVREAKEIVQILNQFEP